MWYLKTIARHYWLQFKLEHFYPEYNAGYKTVNGEKYIDFLYIDSTSVVCNNINSARNIHIKTTKDTSLGNHGGY